MPENVVRGCWFFDEPRIERREMPNPFNRLRYIPDLIRIDHHVSRLTHFLSQDSAPSQIVVEVSAYLDLEVTPAARFQVDALLTEGIVRITKPAGGCRVT